MQLGPVLNLVHILTTYLKVHFNITLVSAPRSLKWCWDAKFQIYIIWALSTEWLQYCSCPTAGIMIVYFENGAFEASNETREHVNSCSEDIK